MTLFFLVLPLRLILWLIRFNSLVGIGSLLNTLHTIVDFMSGRWSQFFVGAIIVQFVGGRAGSYLCFGLLGGDPISGVCLTRVALRSLLPIWLWSWEGLAW